MTGQLKRAALASLKGNWGLGVGAVLLAQIVVGAGSSMVYFPFMIAMMPFVAAGAATEGDETISAIGIILMLLLYILYILVTLFLSGIMAMGQYRIFLTLANDEKATVDELFSYFRGWSRMWQACKAVLLPSIYTMLWSLLLIIPGIVKSFSYAMTYFILLDHPDYTVNQAITESRRLMDGRKKDLFVLYLSFIGWFLLGAVTFGLAFLWIVPYMTTAAAHFYRKALAEARG
ncbi:DUF975 family protein [Ectobacillus ponti]|uniref:DUF975 family protein n=1 Tax=Ectobacillus ponti TaxID=2961894 RepID=A0AA42BNP5_9BACI|nr:DUF975 family protein [Ectobacillus ponti]MCP8967902.1 DUF975 family protein [Ectobacillus ponti]